ncbi:MAG: RsmE family RNA methyltransferase [Candidatus Gracilibacteria bacterium]
MSIHRFFIKEQDFVDDRSFIISSEEITHQWKKVLRFQVGEKVILFNGNGSEYEGEITAIASKAIEGKVSSSRVCDNELRPGIILAQSILKNPEKFEWVLQKGTELGVSEFYPIITRRTERESLHKIDRLHRILVEAAEQCGRATVPVLHDAISFEKFLKLDRVAKKEIELLVPHFVIDGKISDLTLDPAKPIAICIGPEGGFDDKEIDTAKKAGAFTVTLGKRVLRSETAALSAVTLLASRIESF